MYRRSIFTFLDILGFRQIVEKSDPKLVQEVLATLREEAKPDDNLSELLEMSFLTFSDCTVRTVPIESAANKKHPDGILWHEMLSLVHLQYRMVVRGYLLRGGMTVGDIWMDGDTVFGPAIIKAYSLESEFAVYPRIVIDPLVFEAFDQEPLLRSHDEDTEWEFIQKLICRDSDGLYFIDYLRGIMTEFDEEGMEFDFLKQHRQLIVKSAKDTKGINKISAKYLWLATYHNAVVREFPVRSFAHYGLDRDAYLITTEDLPLLYER